LELAKRLRAESTMTWAWILRRLGMAAPGYAAHRPRRQK